MTQTRPETESEPFEGDGHYTPDRRKLVARLFIAVTVLLLLLFITLSQLFAWGRVNALSDRVVQLRTQLEQRSDKSDCLALYRNDVTTAIGVALSANNELWISVATREPAGETPEEQAAQQEFLKELGNRLAKANAPLVEASKALAAYDALSPKPAICPHPGEDSQENG